MLLSDSASHLTPSFCPDNCPLGGSSGISPRHSWQAWPLCGNIAHGRPVSVNPQKYFKTKQHDDGSLMTPFVPVIALWVGQSTEACMQITRS